MSQVVIVTEDNQVKVVPTGPRGLPGKPGSRGLRGADGPAGPVGSVDGAAYLSFVNGVVPPVPDEGPRLYSQARFETDVLQYITRDGIVRTIPMSTVVDVREFGSVSVGVENWALATDLTDHIAAAHAEMERGQTLFIPHGFYLAEPFAWSTPFGFAGAGGYATRLGPVPGSTGTFITVEHSTEYAQVGHTDGLDFHDIFIDGRGRVDPCSGVELIKQNRGILARVRIAHFQRQGLILDQSNRELVFDTVYLRHCADGQLYPQVQINSPGVADDTNNLHLRSLFSVHAHGDSIWIRPSDETGDNVRNLYVSDLMSHGLATAIGNYTPPMDGYQYLVTPEMRGGTQLSVTGVRSLFINGARIFSGQIGQPSVRLEKLPNGADPTEVNVHIISSNIGGCKSTTFPFTADSSTESFTASNYGLTDGARVRVSSTGVLPSPLEPDVDYFVIKVDNSTFQLAETWRQAQNEDEIAIADNGTGVHTLVANAHHHFIEYGTLYMSHCDHDGQYTDGAIHIEDRAVGEVHLDATSTFGTGGRALPAGQTAPLENRSAQLRADTPLTSSTYVKIEDLSSYRLRKNSEFTFEMLLFASGDPAGDLKIKIELPAGSTLKTTGNHLPSGATTGSSQVGHAVTNGSGSDIIVGVISNECAIRLVGTFKTSSTLGAFEVWAAQNATHATPTVLGAKGYVEITRQN